MAFPVCLEKGLLPRLEEIADVAQSRKCLFVSLVGAVIAFALPYCCATGLVTGLLLDHFVHREKVLTHY